MGTLSMKNRVVVVCGHYGSGKTNVAVNLAVDAAEKGETVYLADVDIVNPYFRAADAVSMLEDAGVTPLIPEFANSNVDIPALPPRLSSLISGGDGRIFIDVGGDDGAVVLGRYASLIKDARYDMICVVNMYRPLTETPADAVADMREIEGYSGLRCTGIVNNSSLGRETSAEDFLRSFDYARECGRLAGLPVLAHAYMERYTGQIDGGVCEDGEILLPIRQATKELF